MDPKACLMACDQAISDCDLDSAREYLADYRRWRAIEGFHSWDVYGKSGDQFAAECARRIYDQEMQRGNDNG